MKQFLEKWRKEIARSVVMLFVALAIILCVIQLNETHKISYEISEIGALTENATLQSEIYTIEDGYISKILPLTTLDDLKNNLDETNIAVYRKDGTKVQDDELIGTGMKLAYGNKEYKLAVLGDLNGDGKVGITDVTQINLANVGLRPSLVNEYLKAGDLNGNGSITITDVTRVNLAVVDLIDIVAPNTVVPEIISTKDTITVLGNAIDTNSGIKEYWFEINNSGWVKNADATNNEYIFTNLQNEKQYTVRMKVVDNEGNTKITKRVEISTLNTENANISIFTSTTDWTNENVLVAVNYNSNVVKETKQVSIDDGVTWVEYTEPLKIEKNTTIKARVTNSSGKVLEEVEKEITNIDKLAPNAFDIAITTTENTITVNAETTDQIATTENGCSGIKEYKYVLNDGIWNITEITGENSCTFLDLTLANQYTIQVIAIDNAGNETEGTYVETDTVGPIIEVTGNAIEWTNQDIVLSLEVTDEESAVASVTINGEEQSLREGNATYAVSQNGEYTIIATDTKGNTTTETVIVDKMDKIAPEVEVTGNTTEWTKENVVLTINVTDSESGIQKVTVKGEEQTLNEGKVEYTVSANGEYEIVAVDKVGNTITQTVIVDKIDNAAPAVEVTGNATEWTNQDVVLTINTVDSESGIASVTVNGEVQTLAEGKYEYTVRENGDVEIVVVDNSGNTESATVTVDKIDKTGPTITFSKESNLLEQTSYSIDVTVHEAESGKGVYKYVWLESAESPTEEKNYIDGEFDASTTITRRGLAGDYYLHVYMKDNAGNVTIARTTGIFKFRYEISNEQELIQFNADLGTNDFENKTVYIVNDITTTHIWYTQPTLFYGTLEGGNHTISGLRNIGEGAPSGLIWSNNGTIKNLGLANVEFNNICGGFVNYNDGIIENCWIQGTLISEDYIGGIAEENRGTITKCYTAAGTNIETTDEYVTVGGIVSNNSDESAIVSECYNLANIKGGFDVGGIAGQSNGIISKCYNKGNVSGSGDVGGIVGYSFQGTIYNCYNRGNITSENGAAGIVATINGKMEYCYNTGTITTSGSGGGIAVTNGGNITNTYNVGVVKKGTDLETVTLGGVCAWIFGGSLSNSYNTGAVSTAGMYGGVVGGIDSGTVSNCYYSAGCSDAGIGSYTDYTRGDYPGEAESKTSSAMPIVIDIVNGGDAFTVDSENINDKYPVLTWEVE